MKKDISIYITIATILITIGSSYGIVQSKLSDVDKIKTKTEAVSEDVIVLKTKIDGIKESIAEQRSDLKELLKLMREK